MKKIFNINDVKSMDEFYRQQANRKLNFNEISGEVDAIISSIKKDKDSALLSYTNEFDNNQLSQEDLKLDKNMLSKSTENISKELLSSLKYAHDRILAYHKKLKPENLSYTDQIDIQNRAKMDTSRVGWCLCTRWEGNISKQCSYECYTGTSCGCQAYCNGNTINEWHP